MTGSSRDDLQESLRRAFELVVKPQAGEGAGADYPSVGVWAGGPGHRVRQAPDQRPGPEKKNALAHELVWEIVTAY
jgi:hypothetical protein